MAVNPSLGTVGNSHAFPLLPSFSSSLSLSIQFSRGLGLNFFLSLSQIWTSCLFLDPPAFSDSIRSLFCFLIFLHLFSLVVLFLPFLCLSSYFLAYNHDLDLSVLDSILTQVFTLIGHCLTDMSENLGEVWNDSHQDKVILHTPFTPPPPFYYF